MPAKLQRQAGRRAVTAQGDRGGSIDPCVFTDTAGKVWLLFKDDGNRVGKPANIYLCPLTADALQVDSACALVVA